MRCTFATIALAALAAANPVPQGVSSAILPSSTAPAGCSPDYPGTFMIQVVKGGSKRDLAKRQSTPLELTLQGGILKDAQGRTGYIASNNQFQFDKPPQAGAIYTAGFSVCQDGSLALGADTTWYQCLSGNFYNLYDDNDAGQCQAVHIVVIGSGTAPTTAVASATGVESVQPDGQPTGSAAPTPICQIADGQPQATGCVTQISDGQVQAPTSTAAPVTQISDGQIQATTAVVTQISDGQIQATSAIPNPCTQIVDGQPQCPGTTSAPPNPCTQIVDGQPQCPGTTGWPAPTYGANTTIASATPSVAPATGAGVSVGVSNYAFGLIAGLFAVALL